MQPTLYDGMFGPAPEDMEQVYTQEYMRGPVAGGRDSIEGVIGQIAGRGARDLLGGIGMEDPRMAEAKNTQKAVMEVRESGVDPSDPVAYYKALAKSFAKYGLANKAAMAADKANAAEDKDLDRQVKKDALSMRMDVLKSKSKNGGLDLTMLEKFLSGSGSTAESQARAVKAFIQTGGDFSAALEELKTKEGEKFIGTTQDKSEAVYYGNGEQFVIRGGKKVPYDGPIKSASGITNDLRESTADEKADYKDFELSRTSQIKRVDAARQLVPYLNQYKAVLQNPIITGSLSDFRTWMERFLVTTGVEKDPSKLGNSDLFDAMVIKLVLPQMAMVGGNDSNEEMQRIIASTGDRKMSPETLKRLVTVMEGAINDVLGTERKYEEHRARGGRPTEFSFTLGEPRKKGTVGSTAAPTAPQPVQPPKAAPKYEITQARIDKYKEYVKRLTNRDISDEDARKALEASRPKQ